MRTSILLLLGLVLFSACSSDEQTEALFRQADSLMDIHPDSALHLLRTEVSPQELSRKNCARYALLLARATDKSEQSLIACDSLLNVALDYYDDDEKERAVALLYKGRLEQEIHAKEEAIELLQEGLMILEKYPKEIEIRRHTLSSLGSLYEDARYYEETIKLYQKLYDCCITDKDKSIALNNISFYYSMTNKEDSAILIQHKALKHALAGGDSVIIADNTLSLSLDYYQANKLDSALFYGQKALASLPQTQPKCRYYYNLGNLLLEMEGNRDTASYYIKKSMEDADFNTHFLGLRCLSDLEKEKGNYEAAINYLEEYIDISDSISVSEQSTKIQELIYGYHTKLEVQKEKQKSQYVIGIIILSSSIFCFFIILISQYRINKRKRAQLIYQQTLKQTQNELSSLQTILEDNESIISLLRQKRGELEEEQKEKEKQIQEREQAIIKLQKEKLQLRNTLFTQSSIYKKVCLLSNQKGVDKKMIKPLNSVEQNKLKEVVFNIYEEYIDSLRLQYPRLTENDLLLLCLQETTLSPFDIAICLGHSDTHPLNQRKLRMKEKMKVTNSEM